MAEEQQDIHWVRPRAKILGRGILTLPAARETARSSAPPGCDPAAMRRCAWEIGARWPIGTVSETHRYTTLAPVSPTLALSTWNIDRTWIEQRSSERGDGWHGARLILRLYDVSFIEFDGFNAHRMLDVDLGHVRGESFVSLPGGSSQLAEVGFLLRGGEFLPAARSVTITLPTGAPSPRTEHACYFVDDTLKPELVATPWDGEAYVKQRGKPKLNAEEFAALAAST